MRPSPADASRRSASLNLLCTGSGRGGAGHADAVPGLLGELQTAVEAVAGVDGPVATGLALCQSVPGGRRLLRLQRASACVAASCATDSESCCGTADCGSVLHNAPIGAVHARSVPGALSAPPLTRLITK